MQYNTTGGQEISRNSAGNFPSVKPITECPGLASHFASCDTNCSLLRPPSVNLAPERNRFCLGKTDKSALSASRGSGKCSSTTRLILSGRVARPIRNQAKFLSSIIGPPWPCNQQQRKPIRFCLPGASLPRRKCQVPGFTTLSLCWIARSTSRTSA